MYTVITYSSYVSNNNNKVSSSMTRARAELVDLSATSYYHCINRCVRRAFLCGSDHLTGKNYEHRKTWVVERLTELASAFAVEVCAYAVMSNHYHLVLRVNKEAAENWTEDEVIERWQQLFKLPLLVKRYVSKKTTSIAEIEVAQEIIGVWRERLSNISWYMRMLNEHLARKANAEDNCKGLFWEGRFKSQALLDDAAVLTCMSYVDLNPIRATMADSLENSDFTSIQQRINHWQTTQQENKPRKKATIANPIKNKVPLVPLVSASLDTHIHSIGYQEKDYLELVDWAGRGICEGKRGYIPDYVPQILNRLGIEPENYLQHVQGKRPQILMTQALGRIEKLREYAAQLGVKFIKGYKLSQAIYR